MRAAGRHTIKVKEKYFFLTTNICECLCVHLVVERSDVLKAEPAVVEDLGYRRPLVRVQLQHPSQQIL